MILEIIAWILLITAFTCVGSWYAKKYNTPDGLIGLYVAFVLISNIISYKIAAFNFGAITFFAPAATIIFSVTFLLTDIINEKFGKEATKKMILIALVAQITVACFIWIAIALPSAPFFGDQEAFAKILGFAPRIMLASWIAFYISETLDANIFSWFKRKTKGKHLWARNVFSSIPAMAIDTVIFVTIAFIGVQPLIPLIIGVVVLKWIIAVLNIPFMYVNRAIIYKKN